MDREHDFINSHPLDKYIDERTEDQSEKLIKLSNIHQKNNKNK